MNPSRRTTRIVLSALTAATFALGAARAVEAQPAPPAPPCLQDGKSLETAAQRALIAFKDAPGDDVNSKTGRSQAAMDAYAYSFLAVGQVGACYAGSFVMFGEMANVTLHCDGWTGGGTPHSSGGPAAEAACQDAYRRYTKSIADVVILGDDSDRSRRTAGAGLNRLLDRNPPEPLRTRTRELRDAIAAYGAGWEACRQQFKSWRPPQAALAPPKGGPISVPTPPVLTSFEGHVGARLTVHLDSGRAVVGAAEATLDGGVTISLRSDPSTRISVNGHVTLRETGGASMAPIASAQVSGGASPAGLAGAATVGSLPGGPSIRTWTSVEGRGSLRASLWGLDASLGETQTLAAGSDGLVYLGNSSFDFLGCRYDSDGQSRFEPANLVLHGRLTCGAYLLNESTVRFGPSGRGGSGRLDLFGHAYDMTFDLGGNRLKAHGRYQAPTTGWTRLPGLDAEWRVSRPTVDVSIDGPAASVTFDTDKVEVETVSRNRSGQPWAQASIDPDPVSVGLDGNVLLRLAQPPQPQDVAKGARDLCLAAASNLPPGSKKDAAVAACQASNPAPPAIPNVPTSITVNVGVVVK